MAARKEELGQLDRVRGLIEEIEAKVTKGELKATLGDYMRLLQLERELKAEEGREVRLEWVKEEATSDAE